jgi:hypothetical protein
LKNEPSKASTGAGQQPDESNGRYNVITKFAFATTVGFIPGNPYKQNQDSFILAPNLNSV